MGRLPSYPQETYDAPSTTAVAALVRGNQVTVGWVGDSRAYWIPLVPSQGVGVQLTRDHAWAAEMVATGQMSAAEAARSPKAHAITRWIGADAGEDCGPEVATYALTGPGYLLLSSDGLWNYAANPGELAALIQAAGKVVSEDAANAALGTKSDVDVVNATAIAQHLVDHANTCGGRDNITVALLIRDTA